jgi:hypothetical protein
LIRFLLISTGIKKSGLTGVPQKDDEELCAIETMATQVRAVMGRGGDMVRVQ